MDGWQAMENRMGLMVVAQIVLALALCRAFPPLLASMRPWRLSRRITIMMGLELGHDLPTIPSLSNGKKVKVWESPYYMA